jgi:hypothetical protein
MKLIKRNGGVTHYQSVGIGELPSMIEPIEVLLKKNDYGSSLCNRFLFLPAAKVAVFLRWAIRETIFPGVHRVGMTIIGLPGALVPGADDHPTIVGRLYRKCGWVSDSCREPVPQVRMSIRQLPGARTTSADGYPTVAGSLY